MPSSSFTFNSNNNYEVERVQELDVNNPSFIKLSATTLTPFVEIKITPTNLQSNPVLASNIKIDSIIPDFTWEGSTQIPQACEPPPPPHSANSSVQHATSILITPGGLCTGFSDFTGQSNLPQQGPYSAENDSTVQSNQIISNGVSWSEVVLIEVYEADDGTLVNDNFSPEILEDYNAWDMYSGSQPITNNIYPKYVKAFVYLNFGSNGLAGLTTDTTLNLDIDEVEPTYDCADPNATNYNPNATIDDGSCLYGGNTYGFQVDINIDSLNIAGARTPGGISYTNGSTYTMSSNDSYTTTDWDESSYPYGNLSLTNFSQTSTLTITSQNTYAVGDFIVETIVFYLYPESYLLAGVIPTQRVYNFPFSGGPFFNLSSLPGDEQRMYWGWGNTHNNLTATSLKVQNSSNSSSLTGWYNPVYDSSGFSQWHNSNDFTGSQPTKIVTFPNIVTDTNVPITSLIKATEIYDSLGINQYQYFPEKIKVEININFQLTQGIVTSYNGNIGLNYNDNYVLPINIYHNTDNQGTV